MNKIKRIITQEQIIDVASGYQKSRILITAFELDVFTAIGAETFTADEIANKIGGHVKSTERLLNALCAIGFLKKNDDRYSNTEASSRYLVKGSDDYLSRIGHMINMYRSWGTLTEAVKAGRSVTAREYDSRSLVFFIEAMHQRASKTADVLIGHIDCSGVKKILDIGGGSGVYSMAFIRANNDAQAVVFDLPAVTELAKKYIKAVGLSEKIETMDGDYNRDDFDVGYDLVFMSAIVHINSLNENILLIKKAYNALNSGGRIVIQDHIMDDDRTTPVRGAIFALNMLVNTQGGDTYTEKEMRSWLEKAGFVDIHRIPTDMENDLMVGKRSD